MKNIKVSYLIVLPLFLFYLGLFLYAETGYFYLFTIEPSYAYLLDGLNICNFSIPSNVINPGTPLAMLYAITMEIVHLVRHQDTLIQDVMKNPEVYLHAVYVTLISIHSILLFLAGFIIYKTSKSIITSIFFQLTPFASWIIIDIMRPMLAENFIIIGVLLLIFLIYKYVLYQDNETKLVDKYLISFSVVIGLIAATKLPNLPIAIIPFLLLPGYKKKGLFVILSMIAFAIFAYPIFNDWVMFRRYYVDNFLHSGIYGNGPKTIINFDTFATNVVNIFTYGGFYFKSFCIIFIGCILYYLPFLKVKEKNDKTYTALLGILIAMMIMTVLVAKQFKFYYMTSALMLSIPGLYFVYSIYSRNISKRLRIILIIPLGIILLYNLYFEVNSRISWHPASMIRKENVCNTKNYVEQKIDKNQPVLLISDYYGAPYKEFGLFYGMCWCKSTMKDKYAYELKKLYPNKYFYHSWNNIFNYWDNSFSFVQLLRKYQNLILYSGDPDVENSIYSKLHGINRQYDTKFTKIISFDKNRQTFYKVYYDTTLGNRPYQFNFNAEQLDSSMQSYKNIGGLTGGNGSTKSCDFARSGKFSCKLTKDNPYGFTCSISEVSKGEHYVIKVWRYCNNNSNAGLVMSANDPSVYYLFQSQPKLTDKQWQKIEIDFLVPESLTNQDIKIYVWNSDGNKPAYFDDFTIEKTLK